MAISHSGLLLAISAVLGVLVLLAEPVFIHVVEQIKLPLNLVSPFYIESRYSGLVADYCPFQEAPHLLERCRGRDLLGEFIVHVVTHSYEFLVAVTGHHN